MADAINPGMIADPTDYIKAQRQQMIAQALMQSAFTPAQPTNNGQMTSRVSILSPLLKMAQAKMGANALNNSMQSSISMANALRAARYRAMGLPDPSAPQASAPSGPPKLPQDMAPGGNPQSNVYGSAMDQAMYGVPEEVTKQYLSDAAPTPEQKNARFASGGNEAGARAFMNTQSGGERPGMPRYDHYGNIVGYAPDIANGIKYEVGPQGQPIPRPIEGAAEMAADFKGKVTGAETLARTLNSPVTLPTAGGGTTTVMGSQAFGGQRAQAGASASSPGSASPRPASSGQQSAPKDLFGDIPKLNIPQGVGKSPDVFTKAVMDKAASKHAELVDKYGSESDLADQRIAFNNMALSVLSSSETGPLADKINHLRASAQELGVPEDMIPGWAKVAPSQELKKDLIRNALVSLKPTFGARPAASEFMVLKNEANPSDQMTALAIKRLLVVDAEKAQFEKQRANDYGNYMAKGGDPMRFESWYSRKFPLAARLESARASADAAPVASDNTKTINGKTYIKINGQWHEKD